jgi:choline transporter-like protein 2/4/5
MYEAKTKEVLRRCSYVTDSTNQSASDIAAAFLNDDSVAGSVMDYGSIKEQSSSWTQGFFADLFQMRGYIFGFGIGVALLFAFGYLYFLRIPGILFVIIWTLLLSVLVILIVGSLLLWNLGNTWKEDGNHTNSEIQTIKVFSYIGFGLCILYVCFLLVMRKRIQLAIGIVKEAARSLAAMPVLIFLPVLQAIGLVIFLVPWLIYCVYLASSGDIKQVSVTDDDINPITYREIQYDDNTRYAFLYMLFCYFWTSQFIIALGQLIIALSVSAWYFTRDKKTEGNSTVYWATYTSIFKHMGTAAYGSLVIAIIKTIRAILTYLQKKAKKSGNKVLVYILCVLQCCMWCLEKCMKFLNKNAYIQTAIYGYSFCKACRAAFFLIARNVLRVLAVSMVGDFVLLLGKVIVIMLNCRLVLYCLIS